LAFLNVEDTRERHAAARCIQKLSKTIKVCNIAKNEVRIRAATKIESVTRMHICKKRITRKRLWVAAQFSKEARSTLMIQTAFRARSSQKRILLRRETKRTKEKESAMLLQRMLRGRNTRIELGVKRDMRMASILEEVEKRRATTVIQSRLRQRQGEITPHH